MSKPTIRIHNSQTDKVIDREMTNAEFTAYEAEQAAHANRQAEAEAKAIEKSALLEKLGITADEAKLLIG